MLNELTFDELASIAIGSVSSGSYSNAAKLMHNLPSLTTISMPYLQSVVTGGGGNSGGTNTSQIFTNLISLTSLSLPSLSSINVYNNYGELRANFLTKLHSITSLSLPSLRLLKSTTIGNGQPNYSAIFTELYSLTSLSMPAIESIQVSATGTNNCALFTGAANLEYIEIGNSTGGIGSITQNMRLNGINPTNIYNDATKLAALNASIRDHWFANLYDYTGGTAHTLTLTSAFVAHLEPETIQVATDKNWTIVTL